MKKFTGPKQRRRAYFARFRYFKPGLGRWEKEIEEAGFDLQDLAKWAEARRQIEARAGYPEPRTPVQPTDAEPGSEEKIAVMAARAARGEAIFHPDDRQRDEDDAFGQIAEVLRNGRLKKNLARRRLGDLPGEQFTSHVFHKRRQ
ncbi:MAG: hypothetical protein KatS3mg105_1047 [Gemmatales bacterium]|nr:MAG: hypothetical protein KatS3mg105_1047 [Gemmatales bacterium]